MDIERGTPNRDEIKKAMRQPNKGKACQIVCLQNIVKADVETTVDMLCCCKRCANGKQKCLMVSFGSAIYHLLKKTTEPRKNST